ncbi:arsenical resistance protein ArsH [Maritalea mediterranea]|uniref:Arsenical resistance protein ArsH n=1 Tax=Maritalea mediterranea TaxID=2909667 RepID=A0ABS9E6D1_9HYPH|nr:arsenical resistance protein ArsH [Maritalea mediterranea]MCF4098427.1 arsenical resistance protein ArsH [Maritalea mediterranea]
MTDQKPDMPNLVADQLHPIDHSNLFAAQPAHPVRVLMLYGSLRQRSFSRLLTEEAARILEALGAEVKLFNPKGLPLVDEDNVEHEQVQELRELSLWSEAQVWCSPERHGNMTGLMKTQIDWLPLAPIGGVRPTQGRTLALMQVCGGSQSFNTVNQMRVLGRWMRMITIPNQSSVPKAFNEFDEAGRMFPSPYYNRVVDVMEELMKFTLLTRGTAAYLVDRYSERVETSEELSKRVNMKAI